MAAEELSSPVGVGPAVRDVIEVTVTLDDTIVEVIHVTGRYQVAGVEIDADAFALQHAGRRVPITRTWVRERTGVVEVAARRTAAPRRHALHGGHGDRRALGYIAVSLAAHLLVWASAPEPVEETPRSVARERSYVVRVASATPAVQAGAWEIGDSPDFDLTGGGRPMPGAEGKAGGDSKRELGHAQLERRDQSRMITREQAIEAARSAGLLGSTTMHANGFAALVGSADPSSGFDTKDIHGPLYGGTGEAGGRFGLGRSGFGDSAGCQGANCAGIIGVGRYGTISNGQSVGDHWGGRFGADGGRRRELPTVILCGGPRPCVIDGGLDKLIVRRYVRRQLPKIQYCFEKELLANPELSGVVSTEFLIANDGHVQSSTASGVSEPVATCVAEVLKNIEFPRAVAGSTQVHYPFTFRHGIR